MTHRTGRKGWFALLFATAVLGSSCDAPAPTPTATTAIEATSDGPLAEAERDWCEANMEAVVDLLNAGRHTGKPIPPSFTRFISSESRRLCREAYEGRSPTTADTTAWSDSARARMHQSSGTPNCSTNPRKCL